MFGSLGMDVNLDVVATRPKQYKVMMLGKEVAYAMLGRLLIAMSNRETFRSSA